MTEISHSQGLYKGKSKNSNNSEMKAPIKQILVSNGRRDVPLGGYSSPSAKSWLYKDLNFWPSGRRPLCTDSLMV